MLQRLACIALVVFTGASGCKATASPDEGAAAASEADVSKSKSKPKRKPAPPARCEACESSNCRAKDAAACHALAEQHGRGQGVPFDLAKKAHFEKLACDNENAFACTELGFFHEDGTAGITHDVTAAAKLYQAGCEGGDGAGCIALGLMFQHGVLGVADLTQAKSWFDRGRELFEKGCEGTRPDECRRLGELHLNGIGVKRDAAKAYQSFEKGCPASKESCAWAALSQLSGDGAPHDVDAALKRLQEGCADGTTRACTILGQELWLARHIPADYPRAIALLTPACDQHDGIACGALGAMLEAGNGVTRDFFASLTRRESACQLRNSLACREAAILLMNAKEDAAAVRARAFLRSGCNIGDGDQCALLAILHRDGHGSPPDPAGARALWNEACQRRIIRACVEVIKLGDPLPLIPLDAKDAHSAACQQGIQPSCAQTL